MATKPEKWDIETDVLIAGTGGAGLVAAIIAHDDGAKVTIIEKTNKVGGTTAVSGGIPWVPNNHHMSDVGVSDSTEEAFNFMKTLAQGRSNDDVIRAFVENAPAMIKYIEDNTPLKVDALQMPDYKAEVNGGKMKGRSLGPPAFDPNELGDWRANLRWGTASILPMSYAEYESTNAINCPMALDYAMLAERMSKGIMGMGMSLIGNLLKGCLDRGVEPVLETRGRELIVENDRVIGMRCEKDGKDFFIRASKGVILATGGFEWDDELKSHFLPGPYTCPLTPPSCEGDGLRMAMAVGADLANMSEIWGVPTSFVPTEEYDGKQLYRITMAERCLPHTIMVNRYGKRFVDEAHNYNDVAKVFRTFDPVPFDHINDPAWCVFDQQYRDRYWVLMTAMPGDGFDPEWLPKADTLEELANMVGINAENLKSTVDSFNEFAREGVDHDFDRGGTAYDKYCGDPRSQPNPCLGTIEQPPYYAVPVYIGTIGTKGGPRTNVNGQVLNAFGDTIDGLYAAGNVAASVSGPAYGGGGFTIGLAMTWGYIAAKHAAR